MKIKKKNRNRYSRKYHINFDFLFDLPNRSILSFYTSGPLKSNIIQIVGQHRKNKETLTTFYICLDQVKTSILLKNMKSIEYSNTNIRNKIQTFCDLERLICCGNFEFRYIK